MIVPNTFTNSVDFLVADHVNHFTHTSLQTLLANHGFDLLEADAQSHRGAFVVTAVRRPGDSKVAPVLDAQALADTQSAARKLAFWQQASSHLTTLKRSTAAPRRHLRRGFLRCLHRKQPATAACPARVCRSEPVPARVLPGGKPVVALDSILDEVEVVYLAVNPVIADEVRHTVEAAYPNRFRYFRFSHDRARPPSGMARATSSTAAAAQRCATQPHCDASAAESAASVRDWLIAKSKQSDLVLFVIASQADSVLGYRS
ncbi:hypothetical protein [Ralstonia sp. 1B3]|uniref:hypothetical protein n=1 Tax=Ralstonia sp. 1B3 TaxID=2997421 RepID=UPI002FC9BD2E